MTVEVGKVYFVSIKYPTPLNDPSPVQPQPPPSSHGWCTVNADSSTSISKGYGHVGLVLHYDDISKLGVIFLGTRNPQQVHRFVPWFGTVRKAFQPLAPLEPDPLEAFCDWPGYINFSHAILVKVIGMNDPVFPSIPDMAMVRDMVVNGDLVNTYVRPSQIAYLQSLHANYWLGKRFSQDGFYLSNSNVGDSETEGRGNGTGSGGGSKGEGGGDGTGSGGGSKGEGRTNSSSGDTFGGGGNSLSSGSTSWNPIDAKSGLTHSTRVKMAMIQEHERFLQAQIMDGELDVEGFGDPVPCFLSPLTKNMLKELSDVKNEDNFPYGLTPINV